MQWGQIISALKPLKCNLPLKIMAGSEMRELSGLVDSGNKVRHPLIVSVRLARMLKLKLNPPPPGLKIGTAAAWGSLRIAGIGSPVSIQIRGHEKVFRVKPLVIQNLSHHVNLGSEFLNRATLMLDFSGEDLWVRDPSGATTYMVNQMQTSSTDLFTLSISALCTIGTNGNGKSERFHSYAGIPQVRNRNSDQEKFSSWEVISG